MVIFQDVYGDRSLHRPRSAHVPLFFHVQHKTDQPDHEGSELADIRAARAAALRLCGEMIQELDGGFWDAPLWQLRVTNQDQRVLFMLTFSAENEESAR